MKRYSKQVSFKLRNKHRCFEVLWSATAASIPAFRVHCIVLNLLRAFFRFDRSVATLERASQSVQVHAGVSLAVFNRYAPLSSRAIR